MDHDGQLRHSCKFHLCHECLFLDFARRMVIEVIEADFAPRNDVGSFRQSFQFLKIGVSGQLGFVRMDADRRVDELVLLG